MADIHPNDIGLATFNCWNVDKFIPLTAEFCFESAQDSFFKQFRK